MTLIPPIARLRRSFDQPELHDPPAAVVDAIRGSKITTRVPPGGTVAVTVGSRGIAGIETIVKAAVGVLRELGFRPFIVAAMGSHGGGSALGQRAILAELGITEESVGCPVRTEMETVALGTNSFGLPIHFDRNAQEADGIILLNRIKPHTSFTGRYESGLLKMLAVGLGKQEGAAQVHRLGLPGLRTLLPEVGALLLKRTPVALGIALLENARDRTARVVMVEPEELLDVEPGLLDEARTLMPGLPFDQIDVLVVGELGKNYSGTGLDPNVIGRQRVETMPDLPRPVVTRLAVLDLSAETRGNGLGIGLADLTTDRLVRALDTTPMRVNSLTSNFLARARVPISLPTDRDVITACLETCWRVDPLEARLVVIPNTLELDTIWVTKPLAEEVRGRDGLTVETGFEPMPLDTSGNLEQERLFPESVRATRGRKRSSPPPCPHFRAVVFDLDGLMFDTEALFHRVTSELLGARGKVFTTEMMNAMIGRRAVEAHQALRDLAGLDEPPEVILAEVRERFAAEMDSAVHPTPGLFALLDRLEAVGLPKAVATSSRRSYAERLLDRHGLLDRFAFVLASEDVSRGKPDPEIYRKAASRFDVPPEAVLVLEDSAPGLTAAKGAGAFAVGVPHDHSPATGLGHADLVVGRLDDAELLSLVEGAGGGS